MQLKSLFAVTALAAGAVATPTWNLGSSNKIPGYPWGIPGCLNDQQAQFIQKQFKSILTNTDRKAAGTTATQILDPNYTETSDSINALDNKPQGAITFNGRQDFINGVVGAPAIPVMKDLDVIHDCTKIVWQWLVDDLALDVSPVKGFNKIIVDPNTGIIKANEIEFNNIAWGRDLGWTCTPPAGH